MVAVTNAACQHNGDLILGVFFAKLYSRKGLCTAQDSHVHIEQAVVAWWDVVATYQRRISTWPKLTRKWKHAGGCFAVSGQAQKISDNLWNEDLGIFTNRFSEDHNNGSFYDHV
jgi:hypothetical protein